MESRRVTRSRRATPLPVSPIKQAVMANVMKTSTTSKRTSRKVLADKTNATPVAGLVPTPSPKKTAAVVVDPSLEQVSTPCSKVRSLAQLPATPVLRGEDLLRSLVQKELALIQTPANGVSSQSPQADTPQFRVPLSPYQDILEPEAVAAEVSSPEQREILGPRPEGSPQSDVTIVSPKLSSAWVGRDVDEVTGAGEDDDSDCSVVVNVSSPSVNQHLIASPAPAIANPTTPTVDFKWQQRGQKVKVEEDHFNYYEDEGDDYEGCDEYDAEDFGQVVDCDELCQGISRISVAEGLPEHKGRHIRFNYNSEDEIEEEEVEVMRLRGIPTPRGKHLRFPEDKEISSP